MSSVETSQVPNLYRARRRAQEFRSAPQGALQYLHLASPPGFARVGSAQDDARRPPSWTIPRAVSRALPWFRNHLIKLAFPDIDVDQIIVAADELVIF